MPPTKLIGLRWLGACQQGARSGTCYLRDKVTRFLTTSSFESGRATFHASGVCGVSTSARFLQSVHPRCPYDLAIHTRHSTRVARSVTRHAPTTPGLNRFRRRRLLRLGEGGTPLSVWSRNGRVGRGASVFTWASEVRPQNRRSESATLAGPHGRTAASRRALSGAAACPERMAWSREDSAAASMASQPQEAKTLSCGAIKTTLTLTLTLSLTLSLSLSLSLSLTLTLRHAQHAAPPTSRTVQAARRHRSAHSPSRRQHRPPAGRRARARRRLGRPWSPLAGCSPGWPNAVEYIVVGRAVWCRREGARLCRRR